MDMTLSGTQPDNISIVQSISGHVIGVTAYHRRHNVIDLVGILSHKMSILCNYMFFCCDLLLIYKLISVVLLAISFVSDNM